MFSTVTTKMNLDNEGPWPWEQIHEFLNFPCPLGFLPGQVMLPNRGFPSVNLGNGEISVELPWGPRDDGIQTSITALVVAAFTPCWC